MKTTKLFILIVFLSLTCRQVKAQLKINSSGMVSIGGNYDPLAPLHVWGNGIFSSTEVFSLAPMIQASNDYSTVSAPEYTWYGDAGTGIFHPGAWQMGFATGGVERMRLDYLGNMTIAQGSLNIGSASSSNNKLTIIGGNTKAFDLCVYQTYDWGRALDVYSVP